MSRQNIGQLKEGDKINERYLISQFTKGHTNNGSPYLSLILQDNSGTMDAKFWDARDEMIEGLGAGVIAEVSAEVLKYKGNLQLRVYSLKAVDESDIDLADFTIKSSVSEDAMKEHFKRILGSFTNEVYQNVTRTLLNEYRDKIFNYPAAMRNHHDFTGGLAVHMMGMLDLGEKLCELYPILDRELLLCGIFMHDLGKMEELSGPVVTEYTLEGKLIGHISIMHAKLSELGNKLGYQDREELLLLRHMVLSHHGQYEFGSPVLPQLMEAEMLNYIDNIDARMNMLTKALDNVSPGEWSARIFGLENRSFYKPKI